MLTAIRRVVRAATRRRTPTHQAVPGRGRHERAETPAPQTTGRLLGTTEPEQPPKTTSRGTAVLLAPPLEVRVPDVALHLGDMLVIAVKVTERGLEVRGPARVLRAPISGDPDDPDQRRAHRRGVLNHRRDVLDPRVPAAAARGVPSTDQ